MSDILSGKVPAPEAYGDGDQSPLKRDEFFALKQKWDLDCKGLFKSLVLGRLSRQGFLS